VYQVAGRCLGELGVLTGAPDWTRFRRVSGTGAKNTVHETFVREIRRSINLSHHGPLD
jgi:hypothetical protein